MKAIVVGAGPVGCLLAIGLRRRSFDVDVYDRSEDPRRATFPRGHSFNLTLSLRGLETLDPELRAQQYERGVRLFQRVIHRADGSVVCQPYGVSAAHHLLSIPRSVLHAGLMEAAEAAGARLHFRHECIRADTRRTAVAFLAGSVVREDEADLVAGCDGANSTVRQAVARSTGRPVVEDPVEYGFVELTMPAFPGSAPAHQGLHVWPRGDFMLVAQPNVDGSHTTTLFLPLTADGLPRPSFAQLPTADHVEELFRRHLPDVARLLPRLPAELHEVPPSPLRSLRCHTLHHGRTVLLGDAAHTMLPFYGQGVNCGFEDVRVLLDLLDLLDRTGAEATGAGIDRALDEFTKARRPACDAIAELSRANFHELTSDVGDARFQARAAVERELHRRHPDEFAPLYCGVAFSTTPYHEVVEEYRKRRRALDELWAGTDGRNGSAAILDAYPASMRSPQSAGPAAGSELELSPASARALLDLAVSRIEAYRADLAAGRYPPSDVHDSIDLSDYEAGRRLSAELREDDVPVTGADPAVLLAEIFERATASGTVHPHPGFMAHIPSGGLLQGAVGDFVARALNRFPGVWMAAPGLVQIECNVVRWFCRLLGFGDDSFGYLTTSGSLSNLLGLMCACRPDAEAAAEAGPRPATVYASEQAHVSVRRAARLVGVADAHFRSIGTGPDYRIDLDELARTLQADRDDGLRPACVVATAGTTNTGAIDDLARLAELCRAHDTWLHVDACFGGFFRMTARGRAALGGIEEADSIAVDGHKSLFLPHGSSAVLVRDRAALRSTFELSGAFYLPGAPTDHDLVDLCDYGPELSREVRGLGAWLPIKMHGITAFERALDRTLDLATHLASSLERLPAIEVVRRHPLHLPVVVFRLRDTDGPGGNRRLCELICERDHAYVTTTTLPDYGTVVRACILNHRTDLATVDQLVADVEAAAATLIRARSGAG